MHKIITMRDALASPDYFGSPELLGGPSWAPWRALLTAIVGEELTEAERVDFRDLTGREREPGEPVEEFWGIIGRRGGKTRALSTLAAYLAGCVDHRALLAPGQRAKLPVMAATKEQAAESFAYICGTFDTAPALRGLVQPKGRTADTLALVTSVDVEVRAASFRSQRGFDAVGIIADEVAFWRDLDSANPDKEILDGLRPALARTGAPLIVISSPHARRGELYRAFMQHFGPEGDPKVLVARAPSRRLNPTLKQAVIDRAYADDPAAASASYGAEFRTDVEAFVSRDVVDAATVHGRFELARAAGTNYIAFVDAAGGSGTDSMTLAIAHTATSTSGQRIAVLDLVREERPPFSPDKVTERFAEILKGYGLNQVTGDAYAAEWPRERFAAHGISYRVSERNRSEIYGELLPLLNAGRAELVEHKRLVAQLCALERRATRGGREMINHPPGGHDDVINAAAGVLVLAGGGPQPLMISEEALEWARRGPNRRSMFASWPGAT